MLAENFAEQGGGRRNPVGFRGRQHSYAEFYATDVNSVLLDISINPIMKNFSEIGNIFNVIQQGVLIDI